MILFFCGKFSAQEVMNLQKFYQMIKDSNPQLQIAEIQSSLGEIEQLRAKGFLDPEITSSWDEKQFNDTRYYRLFDAKLKIPTLYGVSLVGGFSNSLGEYVNPQEKTPENGLFNLGLEADLLQGLFVTEARMRRNEANNLSEMYQQISQQTQNDFYFAAGISYLDWEEVQAQRELYENVVDLSKIYFNQTRETFLLGEKTAVDTLESYIAWQDWQAQLEDLEIVANKIQQRLTVFLFDEFVSQFNQNQVDSTFIKIQPNQVAVENLPEIREKQEKLKSYQWQERLKREKLKPKLKAKFMPLASNQPEGDFAYQPNNYKFGLGFSYHLFNRVAKAELQDNQAKQELLRNETLLKSKEIETKLLANQLNIDNLQKQFEYWEEIANGYLRLTQAEQTKFEYGESSVFLLNKRQEKWIETQKKVLDVYYKWQKEKLRYLYLSNTIQAYFGLI